MNLQGIKQTGTELHGLRGTSFHSRLGLTVLELIVLVAIILVLLSLVIPIGDTDRTHRYPPPGPSPGNGFVGVAGEYLKRASRCGNWYLSIMSDGRYSLYATGAGGFVYGRESGVLQRAGENLKLLPGKPNPFESQIGRVLLPVKWGEQDYLVAPDRLQYLCDAIIRGDDQRDLIWGCFFLVSPRSDVDGFAGLPEEWANYIKENLVIGTIAEVRKDGRARLDVGSADGLLVGSIMMVQGREKDRSRKLKVVAVSSNSSEVEDLDPDKTAKPLEPGWKAVTERKGKQAGSHRKDAKGAKGE